MECRAGPLLLAMLLSCGCTRSQPELPSAPPANGVAQYASLPGLSSSPDARLQSELALLIQERMTPQQLDADARPARVQRRSLVSRQLPSEEPLSPAAALHDAFPPISRGLVRGELDATYAGGPLTLSPVQLQRGRELLARFAAGRDKFRDAVAREGEGLGVRLSEGILADLDVLDPLTIGCRLEAVAAADRPGRWPPRRRPARSRRLPFPRRSCWRRSGT
jgi:hypothetical protein